MLYSQTDCPDQLICNGNVRYGVTYCDLNNPGTMEGFCFGIPFPETVTDQGNTFRLVRFPTWIPICASLFETEGWSDLPNEVSVRDNSNANIIVFRKDEVQADIDQVVREINCICQSGPSNDVQPGNCCIKVGMSSDFRDFRDPNDPNFDETNTVAITNMYINSCEIVCPDYIPFPVININITRPFIGAETGPITTFYYNGDFVPNYDHSRYELMPLRQIIQHELLHELGMRFHNDATGCPPVAPQGEVFNAAGNIGEDRKFLSRDEKCFLRALYCPEVMTVGVADDAMSIDSLELLYDSHFITIRIPNDNGIEAIHLSNILGQVYFIYTQDLVVDPMDRSFRIPRDNIVGLSIVTILYRDGRKAGRLVY